MSNITVSLIVNAIENCEASNGRKFQKVTFQLLKFRGDKQIKTTQIRSRNLWDTVELEDGRVIKADAHFNNLFVGDEVDGTIETFNTTPYKIDGRQVNQWSGVIFEGENPITVANTQLRNNNAVVVDEHGQPTAQIKQSVATASKVPVSAGLDEDEDDN
jgi:hypothetical protein